MILTCDNSKKRSREYHRHDNGKRLYVVNQSLNWSIILIFMLTHCSSPIEGVNSFCLAPTVELGKEANITCHFGDDISRLKQDVFIYIYKDTGRKEVVKYAWFDDRPLILKEKGYECCEKISEFLVVRIPHTTREHAGKYSCKVVPSHKKEVTPCTLKLTETIQCTSATVQIGESATLTCTFPNETSQIQRSIHVDHQQTLSVEDYEPVVGCLWKSRKFVCASIPGFEVVGDVTNQLTFRINEVLEKHAGNYTCNEFGSSVETKRCVLTVTGTTNTSPNINKRPKDKERNGCEGSHICSEMIIIIGLAVAVTKHTII